MLLGSGKRDCFDCWFPDFICTCSFTLLWIWRKGPKTSKLLYCALRLLLVCHLSFNYRSRVILMAEYQTGNLIAWQHGLMCATLSVMLCEKLNIVKCTTGKDPDYRVQVHYTSPLQCQLFFWLDLSSPGMLLLWPLVSSDSLKLTPRPTLLFAVLHNTFFMTTEGKKKKSVCACVCVFLPV